MRIGLLGPAEGEPAQLREASEFLLGTAGVDQAIYLGAQDTLRAMVDAWACEVMQGPAGWDHFLDRAAALALGASSRELDALLAQQRKLERLGALRSLPPPPARAVELFDDKVVLFVHDKAQLDPEDIENALLIVYGRGKQSAMHRFGPRAFFTPGPVAKGCVAILEPTPDGQLAIAQFDPRTSEPRGRELLSGRKPRVVVAP